MLAGDGGELSCTDTVRAEKVFAERVAMLPFSKDLKKRSVVRVFQS